MSKLLQKQEVVIGNCQYDISCCYDDHDIWIAIDIYAILFADVSDKRQLKQMGSQDIRYVEEGEVQWHSTDKTTPVIKNLIPYADKFAQRAYKMRAFL